MKTCALFAVIALAACGGKQKPTDTGPSGPSVLGVGDSGDPTDHSGGMIPPEKMDEVSQDLARKQMIISQCYARAMEQGEVKHGSHGKVTFEIVISPEGRASSIKVDKTDITDEGVIDCAKKHVQDIEFPQLPKRYETSYTYAMEAN